MSKPQQPRAPVEGDVLGGKYRVIRSLGGGRGAHVFEAEHLWTGKQFALKVLAAGAPSALESRFVREARAACALVHPNVVKVYDVDRDGSGTLFQVQELLRGGDLERLLKSERRLSLDAALDVLVPVMDALALAHDVGVVHRDVRPGNVFLAQMSDGSVIPKLIDFGVSKLLGALGAPDGAVTAEGTVLGAVGYKPPGLLAGTEEAGPASDVWAMAVTLFETLTGAPPFVARGPVELTLMICARDAPHLWERAPHLPPAVCAVIDRALIRDRQQRLSDMTLFVAELCESVGRGLPEGAEKLIDTLAPVVVDTDGLATPLPARGSVANAPRPLHPSSGPHRPRIRLGLVGDQDASSGSLEVLERALGTRAAVVRLSSFADLVDALAERRVDLAWLAPMAYAQARARGTVGLFEVVRRQTGDPRAILLGRTPRVRALEDLAGARVAWVDPWSTSGFALQRQALRARGVDSSTFAAEAFLGSHEAVGLALGSGRADVGGLVGHLDAAANEITGAWPSDAPLVVLTMSGALPHDVIAVGPSLAGSAAELRARLESVGLSAFGAVGPLVGTGELGRVEDGRYDALVDGEA